MTSEFGMKWSTDSLSSWSLSERTRTEYARRKLSETLGPSRRRPAELLDRRQLAKGFCQFGASRPRPSAATVEPIAGNSPPSLPAKDALLRCDFKASIAVHCDGTITVQTFGGGALHTRYIPRRSDVVTRGSTMGQVALASPTSSDKNYITFTQIRVSFYIMIYLKLLTTNIPNCVFHIA